MKDNSKHTVILYLHYLGRLKNLITNNTLVTTKKPLKLVRQTIKGIINIKNKSDESISSLLIDNQLITSAKQISDHFNNFFTSIAEKIHRNIVKAKKTHLSYLGPETKNTIFLSPTVPEDVEDLISSMKTNKASGSNSIPTNISKLFKKEFSKPLSDMINMYFKQGIFPNILNIANVIPIYRKGDKFDCNNCRPIPSYLMLPKFLKNLCTFI